MGGGGGGGWALVLGYWVAELLFLMWYMVVAREIEAKEDRKEREREEREIVSYNQIQWSNVSVKL